MNPPRFHYHANVRYWTPRFVDEMRKGHNAYAIAIGAIKGCIEGYREDRLDAIEGVLDALNAADVIRQAERGEHDYQPLPQLGHETADNTGATP